MFVWNNWIQFHLTCTHSHSFFHSVVYFISLFVQFSARIHNSRSESERSGSVTRYGKQLSENEILEDNNYSFKDLWNALFSLIRLRWNNIKCRALIFCISIIRNRDLINYLSQPFLINSNIFLSLVTFYKSCFHILPVQVINYLQIGILYFDLLQKKFSNHISLVPRFMK